ncbi:rhomboid family intramembrane serine protease [Pseudogemmobacter sonorensis]|uniref:rhomboid family intramembrane serine protease n=1 Tax=Pseudogemmobacter sonorensis TaxID=2989681 RepID=UPI00367EBB1F
MNQIQTPAPVNPLPWIVWALALPIIAMEIVVSLGASGLFGTPGDASWRIEALYRLVWMPQFLTQALADGRWIPYEPWRLVGYTLIHGSSMSAIFAVVILLAMGKAVGESFAWWAVLAVWFGSAAVGVLVYSLAVPGAQAPVAGAFPSAYGLIGAFTFLIWMRLAGTGGNQYRAFTMIGFLMLAQLLFALIFGNSYIWVAELAGFATGFLLSFLVSPGGWGRAVAWLRRR